MEGDLVDKGQGTRMEHMGIKALWLLGDTKEELSKGFRYSRTKIVNLFLSLGICNK